MSVFWNHQAKRGWGPSNVSDIETDGLLVGTMYADTSASELFVWSEHEWLEITSTVSGSTYTGLFTAMPPAGSQGAIYYPSDGIAVYRDSGTAWVPWGPIFPCTVPPAVAALTWVNQGGATADESYGGFHLNAPAGAGKDVRALVVATGATPWTLTVGVILKMLSETFHIAGIITRQAATQELEAFGLRFQSFVLWRYDDPTTFNAQAGTTSVLQVPLWFRVNDDGANRTYSVSWDGQYWLQIFQVGRADFLTADQVGVFVDADDATYGLGLTCFSWELS